MSQSFRFARRCSGASMLQEPFNRSLSCCVAMKHTILTATSIKSPYRITSVFSNRRQDCTNQYKFRFFSQFPSESAFQSTADETLENMQDSIEQALEDLAVDYEISYASGVLTLKLPEAGTWVINKQTPTRQLWWSSPLSGPKRFEYDTVKELWMGSKNETENILELLEDELKQVYPDLDSVF